MYLNPESALRKIDFIQVEVGGQHLRFRTAPLTAQGPMFKILSLSFLYLKEQEIVLRSRELMRIFSPRSHEEVKIALIAVKLITLSDNTFPTRIKLLILSSFGLEFSRSSHILLSILGVNVTPRIRA